ncbi:MAG TPA: hypothetical protein VFB46_00935 [Gemmatimonadaceae bacterium]|nr:hypothetical protein [Gemmatimonadaceae bacterium]
MCGALLVLSTTAGCYTYVPVRAAAPAPGTEVTLSVTDRGRLDLARQMGSGVRRLQGRLMSSTDSTIMLSVSAVEYLDSPTPVRWAGEAITVDRNVLVDVSERRLSRSRSWVAAGVVAVAAALVSTVAIKGFGGSGGDTRPPGGGTDQD